LLIIFSCHVAAMVYCFSWTKVEVGVSRKDMPRPAAVLLGLTLAAFSIGFNTARYPLVWEMVGPAKASESTQSAMISQAEKPEDLPQPTTRAEPMEVKPAPVVAEQVVAPEKAGPVPAKPSDVVAAPDRQETDLSLEPISTAQASTAATDGGVGIRRLPTVETSGMAPIRGEIIYGTIPVYPTTGIN
jgi:hypothetical protein